MQKKCQCGGEWTEKPAAIWKRAVGYSLVFVSVLLFLPTFGLSIVGAVYGVFIALPERLCSSCGAIA